jgi:probable HAF family extracellular repeat protein
MLTARRRSGLRLPLLVTIVAAAVSATPVAAAGVDPARVRVSQVDLGPVEAVGPVNNRGQVIVTNGGGRTYLRTGAAVEPLEYRGRPIRVTALNDSGVVVGWVSTSERNTSVRWERGKAIELASPRGEDSVNPVAVNARGQVLLQLLHFDVTDLRAWGYLWDNGKLTQIGPSTGAFTGVTALNDRGEVAGASQTMDGATEGPPKGFRWDRARGFTPVGALPGADNSIPFAIDNAGQVAGRSSLPDGSDRGFRWQGGRLIDIGTLGGRGTDVAQTPKAMNASGAIVGLSATKAPDASYQPFVWAAGRITALGQIAGPSVLGINDRGLVVVSSGAANGVEKGYAWWNGVLAPLPSLGGTTVRPVDFNDGNVIVGTSTTADGATHAVLWSVRTG